MDWYTPTGETIPYTKLTTSPDHVRSYAYCSDTRYMPQLHELIKGVNTLYHESTYASDYVARAAQYFHSTASQAATVARDAQVGKLILGHYSARYNDETPLLNEARQIFANTHLADEEKSFDI